MCTSFNVWSTAKVASLEPKSLLVKKSFSLHPTRVTFERKNRRGSRNGFAMKPPHSLQSKAGDNLKVFFFSGQLFFDSASLKDLLPLHLDLEY